MSKQTVNKVVLAYSGGLDTSVCIPWLKEHYHCEVVAVGVDLGQNEDLEGLKQKAIATGASAAYIKDLKDEFAHDYISPALKANAMYENKYLLATALGRPLIAKTVVEIAKLENADAVAHGCTGKGNDQVRFDLAFMSLAPELKIIAPVREWIFKSREEEIEYAHSLGVPIQATKEKPYSIDKNLWGAAIECGILEDPWATPPSDIFSMTTLPQQAPNEPEILEIGFEKGVPVSLNGKRYEWVELINTLNFIAGKHGVGIADLIEDRLVGIKSREVYEAPAGTVLYLAHRDLENLVLDRDTIAFKESVSQTYARLIYNGQWFSPLKQNLDAFIESTQTFVTGSVRVSLYKGNCTVQGRKSDFALYSKALATYDKEDIFNHHDGEAFCKLWGLPLKTAAKAYRLYK